MLKSSPFCGETMRNSSVACEYCGQDRRGVWFVLLAFVVFGLTFGVGVLVAPLLP